MVCSSVAKMKTTSWIPKRGMSVSVALASLKEGKVSHGHGSQQGAALIGAQGSHVMRHRMEEAAQAALLPPLTAACSRRSPSGWRAAWPGSP